MNQLPLEIIYRVGSYAETYDLINLSSTNKYLSSAKLIRLHLAKLLCDRLGFATPVEISEFGQTFRNDPTVFSEFVQEFADILTLGLLNKPNIRFTRKVTRISRTYPDQLSLSRIKTRSYWMGLINNWKIIHSEHCHHTMRIPRFTYRRLRENYFTTLALIY